MKKKEIVPSLTIIILTHLIMSEAHRYFMLNKPVNMVSQFISSHPVNLLGDLPYVFPEGTHAIGRLDSDSEGLLLLTTNKKITRLLFSGDEPHKRVYLVMVNNDLSKENIERLRTGVRIKIKGGDLYTTTPCEIEIIAEPGKLCSNVIGSNHYEKHTWLLITLTEGKFRQVRKMMNAVNHRCKRLIRISIEGLSLGNLQTGQIKELNEPDFFQKLNLKIPFSQ